MLLSNNNEKVIDLLNMYDDLKDIDKIRLAINYCIRFNNSLEENNED